MQYLAAAVLFLAACGSVKATPSDGGRDSGVADAPSSPDACVPEADTTLCMQLGSACEAHQIADNCGTMRTVDCGACGAGQGCVLGQCKTPVCTTFAYTSNTLGAVSRASLEDSLESATPDALVIVLEQEPAGAPGCGTYRVIVADEMPPGSGTYISHDVTDTLSGDGLFIAQEGHAITADGLTLVVPTVDRKRLMSTTRSALGMTDFGTPTDTSFAAINATIAGRSGTISAPVLSADGLELIYTIGGNTDTPSLNGVYDAVRTSTSQPFPAGTRMGPPVSDYSFAVGISSDRLTLFMFDSFTSRVLTRTSTSLPFTNPNNPNPPPQISGWDHKPLADCSKLIATISPGGCASEDIGVFTRQ